MEAMQIAQSYFEAWNRHDSTAIVALFTEDGTYRDPVVASGLTGSAIADYASGLFTAFPNLAFEVVSSTPMGDGTVAAQWLMRGTNTGSFGGAPPTGRTVALPGADFITVGGEQICAVQGYFDQKTLVEQLGLQVIVQPYSMGPVSFGTGTYLDLGKRTKPGAFSLTSIHIKSDAERGELREYGQRIMAQMAQLPGCISSVTVGVSDRGFTITAWEDPENPRQLLRDGPHRDAMEQFWGPDFAVGGTTSVWVPQRINAMWVRCTACGRMADFERLTGKCQCGQPLPEHPPYW